MSFVIEKVSKFTAHLTTSGEYVYTCPANRVARITHLQVANVDGAADADVSVALFDAEKDDSSSAGMTDHFYLAKTITVPADASLKALGDMVGQWLLPGDSIYALASANGDLDLVGAVMEYGLPSGQSS
jgi:hypothetical protein